MDISVCHETSFELVLQGCIGCIFLGLKDSFTFMIRPFLPRKTSYGCSSTSAIKVGDVDGMIG